MQHTTSRGRTRSIDRISRGALARARRVNMLISGIIVLSVVDLIATLVQLRSVGMVEANPLAFYIIDSTQSSFSLVCYKLLTVTVCVVLLHRLRHSLQSEIASWVCITVLTMLTLHWHLYNTHTRKVEFLASIVDGDGVAHDRWLTLVE
ncbi:MAG: DUF5658 family protein [Phycisphaerales bacterium]